MIGMFERPKTDEAFMEMRKTQLQFEMKILDLHCSIVIYIWPGRKLWGKPQELRVRKIRNHTSCVGIGDNLITPTA
jgi:hypothetical protein